MTALWIAGYLAAIVLLVTAGTVALAVRHDR